MTSQSQSCTATNEHASRWHVGRYGRNCNECDQRWRSEPALPSADHHEAPYTNKHRQIHNRKSDYRECGIRMSVSTIGDLSFGLIAFLFAGRFHPIEILLFGLTCFLSALILVGFAVVAGSLAFYMGNAHHASQQMLNAILTFSLYPHMLFSGATRFLLLTLLPATFVGAIPVEIIKTRNVVTLIWLLLAVTVVSIIASAIFYLALRRYESGSAINVNI